MLQCSRSQGVLEDVQRLVEISASVFSSHTSAEANPVLRDSRIIHWRHPKTAPSQLVTKSIHSFSIADYNRHDVGGRCACIDTKTSQLGMEVIGVVPVAFVVRADRCRSPVP